MIFLRSGSALGPFAVPTAHVSSQTPNPKLLKEQTRPRVPMVSCQCAS